MHSSGISWSHMRRSQSLADVKDKQRVWRKGGGAISGISVIPDHFSLISQHALFNLKRTHTHMRFHSMPQTKILSLGKLQLLRSLEICGVSSWLTAQQIQSSYQRKKSPKWSWLWNCLYCQKRSLPEWLHCAGFHEASENDDNPEPGFTFLSHLIKTCWGHTSPQIQKGKKNIFCILKWKRQNEKMYIQVLVI